MAPKGWATSSSGAWVDDSAAAAGSFFERAPRTHKQAGGSGWSESGPAPDSRCGTNHVSICSFSHRRKASTFSFPKKCTYPLQYFNLQAHL